MKLASSKIGLALLAISISLALPPAATAQAVTAAPTLDLAHFTGTWYEIARYPNKREKHCVSDAFTQIALADKPRQFQLVNACKVKNNADGDMDANNGSGKQDKSGSGRLKVSFLWPFADKYWVLALSPDSDWALVGSPNHKTLWIFSKTPTLKPEILDDLKAKAAAQGYPTAKLVMTPQDTISKP